MRVALYARRSGRKHDQSPAIESQIEMMERWCESNGHTPAARYRDEHVQNELPMEKRPEGSRLLEEARKGIFQGVVVWETGRLSRVMEPFFHILDQFDGLGLTLFSTDTEIDRSTPTGMAFLRMRVVFTEMERNQLVAKFKAGKETTARDTYRDEVGEEYNYWLGGITPYGYRSHPYGRRRGLKIDDQPLPGCDYCPADVIRWIFNWTVADRQNTYQVARLLNARRVPKHAQFHALGIDVHGIKHENPGSAHWSHSDVIRILNNETYAGVHRYGKLSQVRDEPIVRRVPAIITPAIFRATKAVLTDNQKYAGRHTKNRYLLQGKVRCAHCEAMFGGIPQYGRMKGEGTWWYRCNAQQAKALYAGHLERQGLTRCENRVITNEIEERVWDEICWLASHPTETLEEVRATITQQAGATQSLQDELHDLQRLLDANLRGQKGARRMRQMSNDEDPTDGSHYPQHAYEQEMVEYRREEAELREQLAELQAGLVESQQVERQVETAAAMLERIGKDLEGASWERRRHILEIILKEVVVHPPDEDGERDIEVVFWFSDVANAVVNNRSGNRFCISLTTHWRLAA